MSSDSNLKHLEKILDNTSNNSEISENNPNMIQESNPDILSVETAVVINEISSNNENRLNKNQDEIEHDMININPSQINEIPTNHYNLDQQMDEIQKMKTYIESINKWSTNLKTLMTGKKTLTAKMKEDILKSMDDEINIPALKTSVEIIEVGLSYTIKSSTTGQLPSKTIPDKSDSRDKNTSHLKHNYRPSTKKDYDVLKEGMWREKNKRNSIVYGFYINI